LESLNAPTSTLAKTAIKAAGVNGAKTASVAPPSTTKRVMSPEARQRMAEGQQRRWAKKKRAVKAAAKKAAAVAPVATAAAQEAPKA
jgi:hypothetical protein